MHREKRIRLVIIAILLLAVITTHPFLVNSAPTEEVTGDQEVFYTKVNNYGVVNVETHLNVREDKGTQTPVIATLPKRAVCYIQGYDNGWAYIRSGDVYGYVDSTYLITEDEAWSIVHAMGEENMPVAYSISEEEDDYVVETEADIQEAFAATEPANRLSNDQLRLEIVDFAQQFIGNPYEWGGTSLTTGADCSGFTQSVYAQFGIELPRVSEEQAGVGKRIPVSEAKLGDLIFYEKDGEIYHVVMYVGDGQVVHASSTKSGIKVSKIFYENAVYAVTVL